MPDGTMVDGTGKSPDGLNCILKIEEVRMQSDAATGPLSEDAAYDRVHRALASVHPEWMGTSGRIGGMGCRLMPRGQLWDVLLAHPDDDLVDEYRAAIARELGFSFGKLRVIS